MDDQPVFDRIEQGAPAVVNLEVQAVWRDCAAQFLQRRAREPICGRQILIDLNWSALDVRLSLGRLTIAADRLAGHSQPTWNVGLSLGFFDKREGSCRGGAGCDQTSAHHSSSA